MFPDWDALEEHREVIRFACGIPTASAYILQFVYDLFVDKHVDCSDGSIDYFCSDSEEFLKSLWKETCQEGHVDIFHNRYINIMERNEFDSDSEDSSEDNDSCVKKKEVRIFVPSLRFIFPCMRDTCDSTLFTVGNLSKRVQAEGILFADGNDQLYDTLKVLKHVSQYQDVFVKVFAISEVDINMTLDDPVGDEDTVDPAILLLEIMETRVHAGNDNDDTSVVHFLELCLSVMRSESDPLERIQTLNHMVSNAPANIANDQTLQVMKDAMRPKLNLVNNLEISDSVKSFCKLFTETVRISKFATDVRVEDCLLPPQVMKHLINELRGCNDLRELVLSQVEYNDELGDILTSISSLETVQLSGSSEKVSDHLLAGLSRSHLLKILEIYGCTLSDRVSYLFGNHDHPGFWQLKELTMVDAKLGKVDLKSISTAVTNGKLPLLESLNLSCNVLTDCITYLLGNSYQSGFLCLEQLYLLNVELSKNDLDCLAVAVHCDKLPKVEVLDLSCNVLTDILSTLIPLTDHSGFKSLKKLSVMNCKLSSSDVKNVLTAFRFGKLPNLETFNDFPGISHELLSDFLTTSHPACPVVVGLNLRQKGLGVADVKVLSDAAEQGRFYQLKEIDLSENTLTGCLGDLFGSTDCPSFPSLETLQLENTELSRDDLISLFQAVRDGKLPKLCNLNVLPLNLDDYLDDFVIAAHHPIFPYRKCMTFRNCNLSTDTLGSICTAVRDGKVPNLREVDLSDIKLTNHMTDFFCSSDGPDFPWFRRLCFNNCGLGEVDIMSIFSAGAKLSELEELDLSNNSLTNLMQSLSRVDLPKFKILRLNNSELSTTDLEILANSIHTGKLPELCELDLSNNTLTNCLRYLLGFEIEGQSLSFCRLLLENTRLNKDDVHSLSTALMFIKLPKLKLLSLKENSLCSIEQDVEMLIQSFREFTINLDGQGMRLDLRGNNFSEEFTERMDHFHSEPLIQIKD